MFSRSLICIALGVTLLCSCAPETAAPASRLPVFQISELKPQDRIEVSSREGTVTFDIFSASGIGRARMVRTTEPAPAAIVLNLHLKALEHFKFSFDNQTAELEIPSSGDHMPRQEASPQDPLYLSVNIFSRENTYPIQEGYVQIGAPRAFFTGDAREFSIEWIDFYR